MLKLKLLWSLIKRNWKLPIYLIIALIAFKFYWNSRQELKASKRREHNLKQEMILQWKQDSLSVVKKAKVIDSLEGVLLSKTSIKIKTDTIKIETEGTKQGNWIQFNYQDECFSAWGWFEDKGPYRIKQYICQEPYSLEIMITDLEPDIYGIVKPSNNCMKINNIKFEVAPNLKGAYRDGFDAGEFILGGFIGVLAVGAYVVLH